MFGWCGRAGTLMKLPGPDGLVRMLLQVVPGSAPRRQGSPHYPAVLHRVRRARVKHRLVLHPAVLRRHAGARVRHGNHAALATSIAVIALHVFSATRPNVDATQKRKLPREKNAHSQFAF